MEEEMRMSSTASAAVRLSMNCEKLDDETVGIIWGIYCWETNVAGPVAACRNGVGGCQLAARFRSRPPVGTRCRYSIRRDRQYPQSSFMIQSTHV